MEIRLANPEDAQRLCLIDSEALGYDYPLDKTKKQLETLAKYAKTMHRSVVPQFEGKLGHRVYLAVRLVPDENPATP